MSLTAFEEGKRKATISFLAVIAPSLFFISRQASAIDPDLGRFSRAKEQQIRELLKQSRTKFPTLFGVFSMHCVWTTGRPPPTWLTV